MQHTYKALSGDKADDIPIQVESPQPPITPEDSARYLDKIVAAKIQDSKLGQSIQVLQL